MIKLKFKLVTPEAKPPQYSRKGDTCFDLFCRKIEGDERFIKYYLGVKLQIPEGFAGYLYPRSSIIKKDLIMKNSIGIIECDYRGEVCLVCWKTNKDQSAIYEVGDKCAQMEIREKLDVELQEVDELNETERGEGGFGSSDILTKDDNEILEKEFHSLIYNSILQLEKHEGLKLKVYKCTEGKQTIGIGRNLEDNPITQDECDIIFKDSYIKGSNDYLIKALIDVGISKKAAYTLAENDIKKAIKTLTNIFKGKWILFSQQRQIALIDMVFNLGEAGFKKFKKSIKFIKGNEWGKASKEILDSKWAKQVGKRALTISKQLADG